jgi:Ulp1 protease family, C-terminal catalytic domain
LHYPKRARLVAKVLMLTSPAKKWVNQKKRKGRKERKEREERKKRKGRNIKKDKEKSKTLLQRKYLVFPINLWYLGLVQCME